MPPRKGCDGRRCWVDGRSFIQAHFNAERMGAGS